MVNVPHRQRNGSRYAIVSKFVTRNIDGDHPVVVPLTVTMLMILKLNSAYRETDEVVTAVHVVLLINLEVLCIEALFSQSLTDSQKHI